ncbi:MAG: glycosyl hydrolase-related protein [Anaerococcus sp.]|nr:glycosyl hydrolase-related protein [Anaerococcus sp.]
MKTYSIIMHTHWDREWYFTQYETEILLRNHIIELIEFLEANPDIVYMLDGQFVMIDDFLDIEKSFTGRLKKLISRNQIIIGPWYTQTDLNLPNQESIIRNLYYGITESRKYTDEVLMVGYTPDTFGQNPQMPQIYKSFGIDYSVFWRGISKQKTRDAIFTWEALDGSDVMAITLIAGYQGAKYLPENETDLKNRIDEIEDKYNRYNTYDKILLMNGHDQMPIQKNIKDIKRSLENIFTNDEVKIESLKSYCERIKNNSKVDYIVNGELNHAEFTRVHRTINTTRMDIKKLNYKTERLLYNVMEPLATLAYLRGLEYPTDLIRKILKILFGVHAHDSLGGCNSDEVNDDILFRLKKANSLVVNYIDLINRLLAESDENFDIAITNPLPEKRDNEKVNLVIHTFNKDFSIYDEKNKKLKYKLYKQELLDMAKIDRQVLAKRKEIKMYRSEISLIIDHIDGFEVKKCKTIDGEENEPLNIVSNKFCTRLNKKNLSLVDNSKVIDNFISVYSESDDGDGYDYSPLREDKLGKIYFNIIKSEIKNGRYEIYLSAKLPKNLEERKEEICSVNQDILLTIENINENLEIEISFENKVYGHQLVVEFNFDNIKSIKSDVQFGEVQRENNLELLNIWEKEDWVEKPVNIHNYQSYILVNNEYGLINDTCKGFMFDEAKVRIPILRSFSYLGKSDLVNRPGRASGMHVLTPDNRLLNKKISQKFVVYKKKDKIASKFSKKILTPLQGCQSKKYNRFNLNKQEIINNSNLNLVTDCTVSAIKKCENSEDVFVRLYNSLETPSKIKIDNGFYLSNVYEEKVGDKIYEIDVLPQQIINIIKEKL